MNNSKRVVQLLAATLLAGPLTAKAIPVTYDMSFGANALDADGGTGSFVWDADAGVLGSFVWDFGGGALGSGGINDAGINWSTNIYGGSLAAYMAEMLTGEDVHPLVCTVDGCGSSLSNNEIFGSFFQLELASTPAGPRYWGWIGDDVVEGSLRTAVRPVTPVPEPASLALFGLALASVGLIRLRRGNGSPC